MDILALNQALPPEVAGSAQGWFSRYRCFPVFSAPWVRGRWRSWWLVLVLFYLTMVVSALLDAPDARPLGGLVQLAMQLFVPFAAGPWACQWVRAKGWTAAREWRGLIVAMLTLVTTVTAAQLLFAEPFKQWVAEQVGAVDAEGKRKRYMMMIGINVSSGDELVHGSSTAKHRASVNEWAITATNAATSALFTFWLAGGLGLIAWRREGAALAALTQKRELERAQSQRREAELRLSVLAAQVEPHFLFNTLAGVRSAIATDPARASAMVDGLVDYLRAAIPRLRSDGRAQATAAVQFEQLRAYLGLMATRMPRLRVTIDLPPSLASARCPPLMLISLAENAVKHGIEPKIGAAHIEVRAEQTAGERLLISVLDDGVGFGSASSGSGLGLSNLRERLKQLYGDQATLTLEARASGGVAARLSLPLEFDEGAASP